MRTRAKTDGNQKDFVAGLRADGCSVDPYLSRLGEGRPDILVGKRCRNWLFELKDPNQPPSARKLTPAQEKWHREWKGQVHTVETVEEALAIINSQSTLQWSSGAVTIIDEPTVRDQVVPFTEKQYRRILKKAKKRV